ncbi:MAG: type II and III secretion system protein family protein [Pseudomonadota bacterium]
MEEVLRVALALCLLLGLATPAAAQMLTTTSGKTPNNTMLVRISNSGAGLVSENLDLSLNKSAIIELPVAARDVLVTNPEIVDAVVRTPQRTFIMGKGVGETSVFFFDAAGKQILNLDISVQREVKSVENMIQSLVSGSRIEVASVNDSLILTGTVPNAAAADQARSIAEQFVEEPEKVISLVGVRGRDQVMLRVRIVEMQRTAAKQLGVDLDAVIQNGTTFLDIATRNPFSLVGRELSDTNIGAGWVNGEDFASATIRALERNGLVRILAEPNLTAISGESANFLAGGEFPFPVRQDEEGQITFEFKPVGVGLAFTPVVLGEGRVSLRISTEVSEITSEDSFVITSSTFIDPTSGAVITSPGLTIPGLRVRRTETTVELPSGGSIMIAGLIQETIKQNIDGVPGVKDLPILGQLFRSRDFENNETELVVIVTPYMVKPTGLAELETPTDGFASASDLETLLFGRLSAVYGREALEDLPAEIQGPYGYIVD